MFDPLGSSGEWRLVTPMSKRRCGVGVAVLNQQIYAIGGHDGVSYLNSVERYDPITNQWFMDVAPTTSCRTSVGVAVLDNYLYAIGKHYHTRQASLFNHNYFDLCRSKVDKMASAV